MPGRDGFATLEYIRKLENGKDLPVIFITGRTDRDSLKQCAAVGAAGYIEKPVQKDKLLIQVKSVLND